MSEPDFSKLLSDPLFGQIQELGASQNARLLLVGGAVRDYLASGTISKDLDFMVLDASAHTVAQAVATAMQGHLVPLDWEYGIHRVVLDSGVSLDFSDALGNRVETDLARRDLTINAMALELANGHLWDPYQGQSDLANRHIRMISRENLLEDPLRLIRVFRFAARLEGSVIDADTLAVVQAHGQDLLKAAGERIHYELLQLLDAPQCFPALRAMADARLLEVIFPELTPMRGIGSSGFHHLGLLDHTLELVRQTERLIDEVPEATRNWVRQPFNPVMSRLALIKLGCLMHDIAKPDTMGTRIDENGQERLTFYGHEIVGEDMTETALKRLKVGNDIRHFVKKLVRWHLYPCQFGPESLHKSVLRFFRRMGDDTPDVVLLALADRHSTLGEWYTPEDIQKSHNAHIWLLEEYLRQEPVLKVPPLLNGKEIMTLLNLPPGPQIGTIKDALIEAQQLGEVTTAEEAAAWLEAYDYQESAPVGPDDHHCH